jgi:hypothetical protein
MGGIMVEGFMMKKVGWRIIIVKGEIYGWIYIYESIKWKNKEKERELKRKYVDNEKRKMRMIVDLKYDKWRKKVKKEL